MTELIGQLHQIIQRKLKDIVSQRDQMETIQAQLNSCIQFVTDILKTGSEGEVLKMKTTIAKQVKELTTPFQLHLLKPNAEDDITSLDVTVQCQQYGLLLDHLTRHNGVVYVCDLGNNRIQLF